MEENDIRSGSLTIPRTCFTWDFVKRGNNYHGLCELASQNGFILLPYSRASICFRHHCAEQNRFNGATKMGQFKIHGCKTIGELSLTARLLLLWLEYNSKARYEAQKQIEKSRSHQNHYLVDDCWDDNSEANYHYQDLNSFKSFIDFPQNKNDNYLKTKIYDAIKELIPVTYCIGDDPSKEYSIIDGQSVPDISGKITYQNMMQLKLSNEYRKSLTKLMIYPKYGLCLQNEHRDSIFFYLVSYIAYRFASCQNATKTKIKIKARTLLEHIPSLRSFSDIKNNCNSRYQEWIIRPLFSAINRLPVGYKTEFWKNGTFWMWNWEEYPDIKSFREGYFLFDISDYCSTITQMKWHLKQ